MSVDSTARELFDAKRYKEALAAFSAMHREGPADAGVLQRIAECHYKLHELDLAAAAAQEALALDPALHVPHTIRAYVYMQQGREDEALEEALAAFTVAPRDAECLECYGTILAARGDLAKGVPYLVEARGLEPNRLSIRKNLALAYSWSGESRGYLREALAAFRLRPNLSYGSLVVDAVVVRYAIGFTALTLACMVAALVFHAVVLLLVPALVMLRGLHRSYRLWRAGKSKKALVDLALNLPFAAILLAIYRLVELNRP